MTTPTTNEMRSLLDTLLPGDPPFPCGGDLGMEALVLERLRRLAGGDAADRLRQALLDLGGPLEPLAAPERVGVVAALEAQRPVLFEALIKAAYLTYYGRAEVEAAIRATGLADYARAPQPKGHELPPFDPERDAPRHGRGTFVATDRVRRVAVPEGLQP